MFHINVKKMALILIVVLISLVTFNLGKIQYLGFVAISKYYQPDSAFSELDMGLSPNYATDNAWLSLPEFNDEADITPAGIESINDGQAPYDVFYVHGTGYTGGASWTSSLKGDIYTSNNSKFALANEASIFNSCCNIYAPHYRQTSNLALLGLNDAERDQILDVIYKDIRSAFMQFIGQRNQGKPFFLVSHSQGTMLIKRLLLELMQHPNITDNIIAVYAIGNGLTSVTEDFVDSLNYLHVCKHAMDTSCLMHWETMGDGGGQLIFPFSRDSICVNPLSWHYDENYVSAKFHLGAASISGHFQFNDGSQHHPSTFNRPEITEGFTKAQCQNGLLYIKDPTKTQYAHLGLLTDHTMHGTNFPAFHMNIRKNAGQRAAAFQDALNQ